MFTLSHTTIINIHKEPVDMRLGVYSLQGLIAGSGCSVREGVKTARKDDRRDENRGFFLAPRQPAPFGSFDQDTDSGSVSTVIRNTVYLFVMGLVPILLASRRLKAICRGK